VPPDPLVAPWLVGSWSFPATWELPLPDNVTFAWDSTFGSPARHDGRKGVAHAATPVQGTVSRSDQDDLAASWLPTPAEVLGSDGGREWAEADLEDAVVPAYHQRPKGTRLAAGEQNPLPSLSSAGHCLVAESIRLSVTESFVRIYQDTLETCLQCIGTDANVPYNIVARGRSFTQSFKASSEPLAVYNRSHALDRLVRTIDIESWPSYSPAQERAASQALQKALLCFSSQQGGMLSRRSTDTPVHVGTGGEDSQRSTSDLATELSMTVQKTLFHDARTSIDALVGVESFRMILADIIMSSMQSPFTTPADQARNETLFQADHVVDGGQDPAPVILSFAGRLDYGRRASRKIVAWERRLQNLSTSIRCLQATKLQLLRTFTEHFNTLRWLATTFAAFESIMVARPLGTSDAEASTRVIRPLTLDLSSILLSKDLPLRNGIPEAAERHSSQSSLVSVQWENHLLIESCNMSHTYAGWRPSDADMASMFSQSVHLEAILTHRLARLNDRLGGQHSPEVVESSIQDALMVYWQWQLTYGPFAHDFIQTYETVSSRLRNMHAVSFLQWHFVACMLGEAIAYADNSALAPMESRHYRTSAAVAQVMTLENVQMICGLARAPGSASALLSHPWSEVPIRIMSKAATICLDAYPPASRNNFPASGDHSPARWLEEAKACIDSLEELTLRSRLAGIVARKLRRRMSCMLGGASMEASMIGRLGR